VIEHACWGRRASFLAWFTVVYNLMEGAVSIGFGVSDDSVALWGFGFDSLIEVASAVVVMARLRKGFKAAGTEAERRAVLAIGALFVLLAMVIQLGAILQLVSGHHPPTTLPGLVISSLSLAFMFFPATPGPRALDSAPEERRSLQPGLHPALDGALHRQPGLHAEPRPLVAGRRRGDPAGAADPQGRCGRDQGGPLAGFHRRLRVRA
jgi:hypothetical protein